MDKTKPRVLVFDLDYTLWPFWVDTHVTPPFRKNSSGDIVDASNQNIKCYSEVPTVLSDLHKQGYKIAVASRTSEIEGAKQLITLFNWNKYFSHLEIYPGSKTRHLTNIRKHYGVEFSEIVFFDDEWRNIRDVTEMGVLSIIVKKGVTKRVVADALAEFSKGNSE